MTQHNPNHNQQNLSGRQPDEAPANPDRLAEQRSDAAFDKYFPDTTDAHLEDSRHLGLIGMPEALDATRRRIAHQMVADVTGLKPGQPGEWQAVDAMQDTLRGLDDLPPKHVPPKHEQ